MRPKHFFSGLVITVILQIGICLLLIAWSPAIRAHVNFITVTIVAMVLFSIMLYGAAKVYAKSKLVRLYIQLVMIAVFMKLLLCLALIIGYKEGYNPDDHSFIWPFLTIYLSSTIYEVIFMERVGREKNTSKT